ncbi:MAG: thiopurine S-methyltransferase [Pseudomonadota bacterium]
MDHDFWLSRWHANQIGFHEAEANARLVAHFDALALGPSGRIFVPLCGKTRDIAWFLSKGHAVTGVELSALAIAQLFEDLGAAPTITNAGPMRRYSAANLDVFVGDLFDLTQDMTGPVDAVYDRGALVALPAAMRTRYAAHVTRITQSAPQLVICLEYDQTLMDGPPFSIDPHELRRLYGGQYRQTLLGSGRATGRLSHLVAQESAWLLR